MDVIRHKQIMAHAEMQFAPLRAALGDKHRQELREAQFYATKTNNSAAILPAEARCYISHIKDLVTARANCVADAYTALDEAIGHEAEEDLISFFETTLAARKASFQGNAELRSLRTRRSTGQLGPLLRQFQREASPVLAEARAIFDKQRLVLAERLRHYVLVTKYVVDTSVFNWLADGRIARESLPTDGGFAITHIQVDEINKTRGEERRARLHLVEASLHCKLLPTETLVLDVSRLDHAKLGDGRLFSSIKAQLDLLNNGKRNNVRDALIAEAAVANGYTLVTADCDLKLATEREGGKVIFFPAGEPTLGATVATASMN